MADKEDVSFCVVLHIRFYGKHKGCKTAWCIFPNTKNIHQYYCRRRRARRDVRRFDLREPRTWERACDCPPQYVAIVGEEVAINLQGLASARVEKHNKQMETDAYVKYAYMILTCGCGQADGDVSEKADAQIAGPTISWKMRFSFI